MALSNEYIIVKRGDEKFRIGIKPEWRTHSDGDGLVLLKNKIFETCGAFPQKLTDEDGVTIQSLDTVTPRETLVVKEAPPGGC